MKPFGFCPNCGESLSLKEDGDLSHDRPICDLFETMKSGLFLEWVNTARSNVKSRKVPH